MRIGLIGAGRWGRNAARAIATNATLAWVADSSFSSAAVLADVYNVPKSLARDADWNACDAVWIATPIETHELVVHAALNAHKNVLCEKPLARTRAQAVDLAAEAERRGLVLMADHTWLGHAGALAVARDGIHAYRAKRHALDERGFDAIEDLLPHDVALSTRAMGPVQRVCVDAIVSLDHGRGMHSSLSYRYDSEQKVRRIESSGPGVAHQSNEGELPPGAPEPLGVVVREFIAAIEGHRAPTIGSPAEFIHVAAVIEAAKRSRAKGGWVDVV